MTVHVKKRYKSANFFPRFHRILRCLPFSHARLQFGADSPFHSGHIAAFVPGSQTFKIRETAIFVRGEVER